MENPELDLFVSRGGGDLIGCVVCVPNNDGAGAVGLLGRPKRETGSILAGSAKVVVSSESSIDSAGVLGLSEIEIDSPNPPKESAPDEGFSDLGKSVAAVPSALKEEPRTKPPVVRDPKGFFTSSVGAGGKAVSLEGLAPKGEGDAFENALSPEAFAKGDSPGFAAANPANPPPPAPPEKELNPPPLVAVPEPRRLLPGVLGCPNGEGVLTAPKPDLPNCACCPGELVWPNAVPEPNEGFPNAGAALPPRPEGLPKDGADGFPKAVAPIVEGLPNVAPPEGLPNPEEPNGDGVPNEG
jgi:hypothetical protein